ncbi:MAG TPA: protein kinase, partial [Polyangiales bacterium]|nr:protein kinase [Polyangiales bacterium]
LDTSGNVKLVDFGIARAAGDTNEYKTEAPQLRGKFGYLPPELFTGEEPGPQSDVYAAGVVLYELLTGDNPFRGREVTDSYHKALFTTAPPADTLRSDVTPELAAIVAKALAKERSERYVSAADFADALRPQRPLPDEVCQARLRTAVQAAFSGPLADALELEPLSASDEAWRDVADGGQSLETAVLEPTGGSALDPDARTHAFANDAVEQPTVRRSLIAPTPNRMRLVVLIALGMIGAVLVAAVIKMTEPKEAKVIVIEREPNALEDAPSAPPPPPTAAEPAPTSAKTPPPKAAGTHLVEPEPGVLTKSFAHEQPRIQRCFAGQGKDADAAKDIMVEFHVAASGEVESAQLAPITGGALGACLLGIAKSTHFPKLTRGVTFRIPIQARMTE